MSAMDLAQWGKQRATLRQTWLLRGSGFTLLAIGLAWLVLSEGARMAAPSALMAVGGGLAWASAVWLANLEVAAAARPRKAMHLLVAGYGLKLAALPLVAVGGGWLAWGGGPGFDAALAVAGLGIAAYAYGVVARMDGVCMLPEGGSL
ncbi:MAG: hypothetical protein ABR562_06640 [Thermoplasmatota archaeon]|nr:hypothetical protein [Halobacteriales archaeon]